MSGSYIPTTINANDVCRKHSIKTVCTMLTTIVEVVKRLISLCCITSH